MAHVIAAAHAGIEVVNIVDTDPNVLSKARLHWVNEWKPERIFELATPQPWTVYSSAPEVRHCDLAVIATPPHTHAAVLRQWYGRASHIIVEKPCAYPDRPHRKAGRVGQVSVSGEWVWHSVVREYKALGNRIGAITIGWSGRRMASWGYGLPNAYDLMPHVFSILEYINGPITDLRKSRAGFGVEAGDTVVAIDFSDVGLIIDGQPIPWQMDLFEQQLRAGRGPLTWRRESELEWKLRECLS